MEKRIVDIKIPQGGKISVGLGDKIKTGDVVGTVGTGSKILSPVSGLVAKTEENRVGVEVVSRVWEGDFGVGSEVCGPLRLIGGWGTTRLDELTSESEGAVVVSADVLNVAWLSKATALGVVGVVSAGVSKGESFDYGLAVVGMGEHDGQMEKKIWEELSKNEGKMAILVPEKKQLAVVES